MSSKTFAKLSLKTGAQNKQTGLIFIAVVLLAIVFATGCSKTGSSLEPPRDFIKEFFAKHETMVDRSLVYYYAKEDQSAVARQIDVTYRINKAKGTLDSLRNATFDLSGLQIVVVDKKEEYVNDEPVLFVKVAVKGNYKMQMPEETKEVNADEVIILQMARNEWKVRDNYNPWS